MSKDIITVPETTVIRIVRRRLYTQGRIDSATHPDGADEDVF